MNLLKGSLSGTCLLLFAFNAFPYRTSAVIAYVVPARFAGNQSIPGVSVGMDFDVVRDVIVTRLGVFDDVGNGISPGTTLIARLWNRGTAVPEQLASIEFTDGDGGELIGGSRLKVLPTSVRLPAGFRGTISVDGWRQGYDLISNSFGDLDSVRWTTNDGDGSLVFVDSSRFGVEGEFPKIVDLGPAARYACCTFDFETTPAVQPNPPNVLVRMPYEDGAVTLSWSVSSNGISPSGFEVSRVLGDQREVITHTSAPAYRDTNVANGTTYCYTVRALTATGKASLDSQTVCTTPSAPSSGDAYTPQVGVIGNQDLNGNTAVGMDFEVVLPVRVTRLGVFDDGQNGLKTTLTAAIYEHSKADQPIVTTVFTPGDPGDLIGTSRFKQVSQPVILEVGFRGTIVALGYNDSERVFNTFGARSDLLETFSGGCLRFIGTSRSGTGQGYPPIVDTGPENRFAAATFTFEPLLAEIPDGKIALRIVRSSGGCVVIWNGPGGVLQHSDQIGNQWQDETFSSGDEIPITSPSAYFRIAR